MSTYADASAATPHTLAEAHETIRELREEVARLQASQAARVGEDPDILNIFSRTEAIAQMGSWEWMWPRIR